MMLRLGSREGEGVLNKILYEEAPPRGPSPYLFIDHFSQKRYLFRIALTNGTPFANLV